MEATIVDLRYKMKEVLKALERNENVTVKYRGKLKGTIVPNLEKKSNHVKDHDFFGMHKNESESVDALMQRLRGNRF